MPSGRSPATRQAEHPGPGHQKRRFVQDGEVPVVMLRGRGEGKTRTLELANGLPSSPQSQPLEAVEAQLRLEREAREAADRAVLEANQALKDLRTRIGHASLALEEARETARAAVGERLAAETALAAEREARLRAEAETAALQDRLAAALRRAEEEYVPRRPGRPRGAEGPGRPRGAEGPGRPRGAEGAGRLAGAEDAETPPGAEDAGRPGGLRRPGRPPGSTSRQATVDHPGRAIALSTPDRNGGAPALDTASPKPARGRPAQPKAAQPAAKSRTRKAAEPQPVKWWIKKKPAR